MRDNVCMSQNTHDDDPRYDLAAYVARQIESGDNEVDPYGYAISIIATVLEFALDDGISGAMNEHEFTILETIARTTQKLDPHIEIHPRIG